MRPLSGSFEAMLSTASTALVGQKLAQALELPGPLVVKPTKGRSMRLPVVNAQIVLSTPSGKLDKLAERFLRAQKAWIATHWQSQSEEWQRHAAFKASRWDKTLWKGNSCHIERVTGPQRSVKLGPERIRVTASAQDWRQPAETIRAARRGAASYQLTQQTERWIETCAVTVNTLRVKDVKTRWGSCSVKQNINLNWHLALLPPALCDYVIVHELMHLHELNHSARFWAWVARYLPDDNIRRAELRGSQWLIGVYDLD